MNNLTWRYGLLTCAFAVSILGCRGELSAVDDAVADKSPETTTPTPFNGEIPGAEACVDAPIQAGPTLGRRLTNWEYAFTLQDLLGVDVRDTVNTTFDADLRTEGFTNTSTTLIVNLDRVLAYESLAATVAERLNLAAVVSEHTSCTEFTETCQNQFVEAMGMKLFRRPLAQEEVTIYGPIFEIVQDEGDDFQVAAGLVVEAMLQAPQFLYRLEVQEATQRSLDSFEVASRLSYLIWSSAPDAELFRAAEAGELLDASALESQARRMLADPKSLRSSERFVRDWLHIDRLEVLGRDPELYPEYSTNLSRDMQDETLRVAEHILREEGRPLADLLRARTTFASRELAEFYGFDSPQDGVNTYDLSNHPERVGILTHAGVLANAGGGDEPSLVERGLFILHNVMCRSVDAPSADLNTEFVPAEPGRSQRVYSEARMADASCAGCHAQFDPLGYGLENFDGIGRFITNDFAGNELSSTGHFFDFAASSKLEYANTAEYMNLLAASQTVEDCLIQKPVQFALGRALVDSDACMLSDVRAQYTEGAMNYEELMVAIATHPNFRHIAAAGAAP